MRVFLTLIFLFLSGCAAVETEKQPLVLKPASFSDLPGWAEDNHAEIMPAFEKSCARFLKQNPEKQSGPDGSGLKIADWQSTCRALEDSKPVTDDAARRFFENNFIPFLATAGGSESEGLFTGYYEAALRGSRIRGGLYQTPLRQKPADLVSVELGEFREELRGQRIAGRVIDGALKPYEDRAAIVAGKLPPTQDVPLVWVDDPVDAFFLQIQGSGIVTLDDGHAMRVGYDGQNGHVYYAVGRELVKRGILPKEDVSMQSIRAWLAQNPQQAQEFMNLNKSYVFFRALDGEGPIGGEGVALTPLRSLAVDRAKIGYGVPLWLDAAPPSDGQSRLRRLMIAQDTGGAIRGAVRGDVFWGYGDEAEHLAGLMKSRGRYWLLLPKKAGNTIIN